MQSVQFLVWSVIAVLLTAVGLYAAARLIFSAWFRSKRDYDQTYNPHKPKE